jgi:hypothetical protein
VLEIDMHGAHHQLFGADAEPEPAWYMTRAALGEWDRVVAWHNRRHFDDGRPYSWLEALRATAQNPQSFDRVWDDLAAECAAA